MRAFKTLRNLLFMGGVLAIGSGLGTALIISSMCIEIIGCVINIFHQA